MAKLLAKPEATQAYLQCLALATKGESGQLSKAIRGVKSQGRVVGQKCREETQVLRGIAWQNQRVELHDGIAR